MTAPLQALSARTLLRGWLLVVVLLLAWGLGAAALAGWNLQQSRSGLQQVRGLEGQDLEQVQAAVAEASDHAGVARRLMRQPGPALLARVPVLGRSLAAERDTAVAAAAVLSAAERLLPLAQQVAVREGRVDVDALRLLQDELARSATDVRDPLQRLETTELGWTPAPVQQAVTQAREALRGLDATLADGADLVDAATGLLGGDGRRTLVLAVMNNAELRGAGGYGGTITVIQTEGGRLDIGPFQEVDEFAAPPEEAVRVPAPDDYARRFGPFLADTTLWKEVLMSADMPSSAQVMCEVAKVAPGVPCDGALLLDIPALADLMTLSGPVTLSSGETVDDDELVRELLVEAYQDVPSDDASQAARRAGLRTAADGALNDLLGQQVDGVSALQVLLRAARGRHLAVWSSVPDEQQALVRAGVAGGADPEGADLSLAAFNQFVAGKLDYYVDREVAVRAEVSPTRARVQQEVALTLDTPPGLPPYVQGVAGGRLVGVLDIAVAQAAQVREVTLDGVPVEHGRTTDTGSQRVVVETDLAPGATGRWKITYDVPLEDGAYQLEVLPQALARDATLRLDVRAADGAVLDNGPVTYEGPHDRSRNVQVRAQTP